MTILIQLNNGWKVFDSILLGFQPLLLSRNKLLAGGKFGCVPFPPDTSSKFHPYIFLRKHRGGVFDNPSPFPALRRYAPRTGLFIFGLTPFNSSCRRY